MQDWGQKLKLEGERLDRQEWAEAERKANPPNRAGK
jgi:hypothetical protein